MTPGGPGCAAGVLGGVLGQHDHRVDALGGQLAGERGHPPDLALRLLGAGHRDDVVVEDLVGDVDPGGDRLLQRELAGVEVGAVAEVLEHVVDIGDERGGLADPQAALAAHLGQPDHLGGGARGRW